MGRALVCLQTDTSRKVSGFDAWSYVGRSRTKGRKEKWPFSQEAAEPGGLQLNFPERDTRAIESFDHPMKWPQANEHKISKVEQRGEDEAHLYFSQGKSSEAPSPRKQRLMIWLLKMPDKPKGRRSQEEVVTHLVPDLNKLWKAFVTILSFKTNPKHFENRFHVVWYILCWIWTFGLLLTKDVT